MRKHKFFQDDIYRLNREISRFTDQGKKKVVLSTYNPIDLSVNYFSVYEQNAVDRWKFRDDDHERDVRRFLDVEKNDDFKKFLARHPYSKLIEKYRDKDPHYFLLNLYNNFPVNPRLFFDGIIKKVLSEFIQNDKLLKYAFIDALDPEGNKFNFTHFQWFDMRLFYRDRPDDHPEMGVIADQESGEFFKYGEWFGKQDFTRDEVMNSSNVERQPPDLHLEDYFFRHLLPFFNAYKYDNGDIFNGNELFPLKVRQLSKIRHFLIIPFYDAWIDEGPCGIIQGNLSILPFEYEEEHEKREKFIKQNLEKYTSWSRSISQLLYESRSHEILMLSSKPEDDFLRDFLRKTSCVQEWKRIMVFNRSENHPELRYCFRRFPGGKTDDLLTYKNEWNICNISKICTECIPNGLKNFLKTKISSDNAVYKNQKNNTYFFCIMLEDILRSRILPSIEEPDIAAYKNHIICFEFPEYTCFPMQDSQKAVGRLGEYYINKLIPVFDRLLLNKKVLKHSIRSAVSAIIGRNMSHNIGSHVLSYGPASLKTAETNLAQVRFYEYLRQRMDFIAEICTSDPSWCPSMNLIRDILIPFFRQDMLLNYIALSEGVHRDVCEERDCSKNHHNIHFKVLIGGETCLEAKSEQFFPDPEFSYKLNDEGQFTPEKYFFRSKDPELLIIRNDITVSIPHGIIGCHAFYSILENFIRNSAKHGQNWLKKGKGLEIVISVDERNPDFVKLNISDNMGNCDNQLKNKLLSGLDPSKEPLVDSEGRLNSGNLGLKEMRVCANFLRMRPTNQADEKTPHQSLWSDEALKKPLIELDCEKKICSQDRPCEEPNLQYALYLFKPKEALIICSDQIIKRMEKEDLDRFQKHGIYFKSMETFKTYRERGFSHRFIAVQSELMGDLMAHVKSQDYQIPLRVVSVDEPDNISVKDLYKKWIEEIDPNFDTLNIAWRGDYSGGIDDIFCTKSIQIPEDTNILFDNHGECNREGDRCIYYQPYRADERIYRLLYTIAVEKESQRLRYYELIEASATNVIIADERIWKKTEGDLNFGPQLTRTKREVLNDMRVRLTPIENNRVSLNVIKQFLAKTEKKIPCFFIIHQGIIDKMNNGEQKDLEKIIADYQNRLDHFTYIVTSGRGIPDFSHRAKFIEISNLEKFIEERDKYSLVQTLFALRRPQNGW